MLFSENQQQAIDQFIKSISQNRNGLPIMVGVAKYSLDFGKMHFYLVYPVSSNAPDWVIDLLTDIESFRDQYNYTVGVEYSDEDMPKNMEIIWRK